MPGSPVNCSGAEVCGLEGKFEALRSLLQSLSLCSGCAALNIAAPSQTNNTFVRASLDWSMKQSMMFEITQLGSVEAKRPFSESSLDSGQKHVLFEASGAGRDSLHPWSAGRGMMQNSLPNSGETSGN